jgi:NAD+ kinase
MVNFHIITNDLKDRDFAITNQVKQYLESKGRQITDDHERIDCVLVLGGDGTLLRAAVDLAHLDVPFLGINLGNLGFLAEVEKDTVISALEKIVQGDVRLRNNRRIGQRAIRRRAPVTSCG